MAGLISATFGADATGALRRLADDMERHRDAALHAAGAVLVERIKRELSKPGTGRLYPSRRGAMAGRARRRGMAARGAMHRASAPGQPPAVDQGTLRASIAYAKQGGSHRVGTNIEYAPALEFGTLRRGGKIAPRPFMRPSVLAARREMSLAIVGELRVRRGGFR